HEASFPVVSASSLVSGQCTLKSAPALRLLTLNKSTVALSGCASITWKVCVMDKQSLQSKAQDLLDFARSLQDSGLTWVEANNAIYGPGGRFVKLFPTKPDRVAFARTDESHKIDELIDHLPEPDVRSLRQEYSGKFVVRI